MSNYIIELKLDEGARSRLFKRLIGLTYPASLQNQEAFIREAFLALYTELPSSVQKALDEMKTSPNPAGALVLRNLPVDPVLPTTPAGGRRSPDKHTFVSEALLLGIARWLGEPYSFQVEKGDLVHDVSPVKEAVGELTNRGSGELGFHTELAAFEHPPRWLLLLGLRPDHARVSHTPVADIRKALPLLDRETHTALRKVEYQTRMPFIFDPLFAGEERFSAPHAVLTGPVDSPQVRAALYGGLTRGLTEGANIALEQLQRALAQVKQRVLLDQGVMVILSNYVVLHGRSSYTPQFGGTDRWFQRVNVADTLWPLRQWQHKRVRLLG